MLLIDTALAELLHEKGLLNHIGIEDSACISRMRLIGQNDLAGSL